VDLTYRVLPDKAPELFVTLSNQSGLPQGYKTPAEQAENPILQKVVLPLIRGYVRIEGSKMEARNFVSREAADSADPDAINPRERLQKLLVEKVTPPCRELGIVIESITIGQSEKDADLTALADQIAQREVARLQREKNLDLIKQYAEQKKLKAKEALAQQNKEKVDAETELKVAEKAALQRKEVEEAKLKQDLAAAAILLAAAKKEADAILAQGQADADVIVKQNEAEVAGLKAAVQGFSSAEQYAQYQVLLRLAPNLKEVFASDNGDFAKLFSAYMTPPKPKAVVAAPPVMPPAVPDGK
jgi:hypothetical protein